MQLIPLSDYLQKADDTNFVWDEDSREQSDEWLDPIREAGLDYRKHKVFAAHTGHKRPKPPKPFTRSGPELGDSGSTVVYRVTAPAGVDYGRPLALKVISLRDGSRPMGATSQARLRALGEVATLAALRHPHIVRYVASYEEFSVQPWLLPHWSPRPKSHSAKQLAKAAAPEPDDDVNSGRSTRIGRHVLGIAMYPPGQCNLRTLMEEVAVAPDTSGWIMACMHNYFGCLSQAVAYLHRNSVRIRHKDIKPENIVIDKWGVPILTDFGLSKHFERGQYSQGPTFKTLKYADPEAIKERPRDERSDIFSLGCVFLEIATVLLGQHPEYAEQQLSNGTKESYDFHYSEHLHNLDSYLEKLSNQVAPDLIASDPSREASAKAIVAVLPYIRQMMDVSQWRRPKAKELYPWFRHLYDIHEHPGPCRTCEEERRTGRAIPLPNGDDDDDNNSRRSCSSPERTGPPSSAPVSRTATSLCLANLGRHNTQISLASTCPSSQPAPRVPFETYEPPSTPPIWKTEFQDEMIVEWSEPLEDEGGDTDMDLWDN